MRGMLPPPISATSLRIKKLSNFAPSRKGIQILKVLGSGITDKCLARCPVRYRPWTQHDYDVVPGRGEGHHFVPRSNSTSAQRAHTSAKSLPPTPVWTSVAQPGGETCRLGHRDAHPLSRLSWGESAFSSDDIRDRETPRVLLKMWLGSNVEFWSISSKYLNGKRSIN